MKLFLLPHKLKISQILERLSFFSLHYHILFAPGFYFFLPELMIPYKPPGSHHPKGGSCFQVPQLHLLL